MSDANKLEFETIPMSGTSFENPPRREPISTLPALPPLDPPALSAPVPKATIPIPPPRQTSLPVKPPAVIDPPPATPTDPVVNKFVNPSAEPTANRSIPSTLSADKPPTVTQSSLVYEMAMLVFRPTRAKLIFATGLASLLAGAGFVKLIWPVPVASIESASEKLKSPFVGKSPLGEVPAEMAGAKNAASETVSAPVKPETVAAPTAAAPTVAAPVVSMDLPPASLTRETPQPKSSDALPEIQLPAPGVEAGSTGGAVPLLPKPVVLESPSPSKTLVIEPSAPAQPLPLPKVQLAAGSEPVAAPAPPANAPGVALPAIPGPSVGLPPTPPLPEVKLDLPKMELPGAIPSPATGSPPPPAIEIAPIATPPAAAPPVGNPPPAASPVDLGNLPKPTSNSSVPLPKLDLPAIEPSQPLPSRDPGPVALPTMNPAPTGNSVPLPTINPAPAKTLKPAGTELPKIELTPAAAPPPATLPAINVAELPATNRNETPGERSKIRPAQARIDPVPVKPLAESSPRPSNIQTEYDEDLYYPQSGDTFTSVSKQYYGDDRYASALQAHNEGRAIGELRTIRIPPIHILRKRFPSYLGRPAAEDGFRPKDSPPGGLKMFIVPSGGRTIKQISEAAFGDENLWGRVFDLNRGLFPDRIIPEGTRLALPADSRIGD